MLNFEESEYQTRLQKVKERMNELGIRVLLVTDPANMNYLTGYDGWSFYVHQLVIVLIDQEQPIWVGRGQDANGAKVTTWLDSDHIRAYTDDYVHSTLKHPMDYVATILQENGYGEASIGVEMDSYYFTAKCLESLKHDLPKAAFQDANLLVNWVRLVKSNQEIEYMKKATQIVKNVMQTAMNAVQIGVRECDVAAKVYHAQMTGTEDFGGDYPAIVPLMPSGERTSTPHLTWTDRRYKHGDLVILELAGCYKRYHAPLARTMILGEAPQKVKDLSRVVIEGISAALDFIKPGVTCAEIERVWKKSIEKSGFIKDSRIGYSMGLNYPPDWGEHTASIRPGDKTVLQPNMTFHMIPGIWQEDYGVEISEPFRVTEQGCELFVDFSRQLLVK
ncbi:M24 family metallopeptidase [Desulfosporosinus youngiae]|uniref:Xaa-Pro aminopeptidase n=1 Tax=Desulfosporosinus youngiae DSM 17734 TaxID=768710 RepID=H5XUZ5_9FIRM|nr:M24 family metallopeptidase [Desulfosporosinus youngiae]EHQ89447.1 Xaa-Pro aminopeptidase [Desulfosporosinus youngiae DSM 17734]